mmetsp:Transcript_50734/g.135265  ORF Transcript_50734/g.135265 Transcript_50734/m.135265 type:complete len:207 (-) Transcript_50734:3470-4090(-)
MQPLLCIIAAAQPTPSGCAMETTERFRSVYPWPQPDDSQGPHSAQSPSKQSFSGSHCTCSLHSATSSNGPSQGVPPCLALVEIERTLFLCPPLHVESQTPHSLQSENAQSTTSSEHGWASVTGPIHGFPVPSALAAIERVRPACKLSPPQPDHWDHSPNLQFLTLPGQWPSLQVSKREVGPEHPTPPFAANVAMSRYCSFEPLPQV